MQNYFLATCKYLNPRADLDYVVKTIPFGGIIGIDNSKLDYFFRYFKLIRLHAILHDASGFVKSNYNIGPGYCYALSFMPISINNCFLGHVSGLLYCLYHKLFHKSLYDDILC